MRNATALLLLAMAAAALAPAASALAAGADPDSSVAVAGDVDPAALVPAPAEPPVPAVEVPVPAAEAPIEDAPDLALAALAQAQAQAAAAAAATSTVSLDVPAVSVQAGVDATVAVTADPPADPDADGPSPMSPSGSGFDPALAAAATAPLAAAAVGAAVFGGVGLRALQASLATKAARALRALLGLLPLGLFSRIDRGQLLDNPVRARVHDAVAQDPGLTLSEVQARAGVAWGTTVHHLRRLESHGLLVSITQNAHRRYFVSNTPAAARRSAVSAIRHPTARRIADLVLLRPGIDQSGVCQELGLNGPSVSKHLGQFRGHGLIESERQGRRTLLHPTDGLRAATGLLASPAALAA